MNPITSLQNLLDLMATPTDDANFTKKNKRAAIDNALVQFQQALAGFPEFVPELTKDHRLATYTIKPSVQ